MKRIPQLAVMIILFSAACKTTGIDLVNLEKNGEVILRMERTPCYGKCPVYDLRLYNNGLLIYNGKKFTENKGAFYTIIPKSSINQLSTYMIDSGFFDLENKYPPDGRLPSDLPSCIIYFKQNNREKEIRDGHWQTPEVLIRIEKKVDSLITGGILHSYDK